MIRRREYSVKSDVWMYGCVVIEILTGNYPYAHIEDLLQVAISLRDDDKFHPEAPKDAPQVLKDILEACFQYLPADRPTFSDIMKMFKDGGEGGSESDSAEYSQKLKRKITMKKLGASEGSSSSDEESEEEEEEEESSSSAEQSSGSGTGSGSDESEESDDSSSSD